MTKKRWMRKGILWFFMLRLLPKTISSHTFDIIAVKLNLYFCLIAMNCFSFMGSQPGVRLTWYFESLPCIIYVLWVSFTYQVTSLNQSDSSKSMGARSEPRVVYFSLWSKNTHMLLSWTAQDLLSGKILHLKTNPKCSYPTLSLFPAARVTFKRIKPCRSSHISRCREDPYESILVIHRWWHPPFSKQVSYILACSP